MYERPIHLLFWAVLSAGVIIFAGCEREEPAAGARRKPPAVEKKPVVIDSYDQLTPLPDKLKVSIELSDLRKHPGMLVGHLSVVSPEQTVTVVEYNTMACVDDQWFVAPAHLRTEDFAREFGVPGAVLKPGRVARRILAEHIDPLGWSNGNILYYFVARTEQGELVKGVLRGSEVPGADL